MMISVIGRKTAQYVPKTNNITSMKVVTSMQKPTPTEATIDV